MHCGEFSTTCCAFKNAFIENKLNEEIDWGVNLRRDRNQEKDILFAEEPSELNIPKKKHHKRKKCKKHKEIPLCQKLSEKITFNRDTATFKQYIDILARPRPYFCPPEPERPKKVPKICSPRCAQMALPTKKRVLCNWQDYYEILSPEQILWLKELLSKEEALLPLDAYDYFKKLDKETRKQKKLKKKKEKLKKVEKPKKSKVIKEINCLAKCIVNFFSEKMLQTVKCSHIMLTNLMKEKLEENHLIQPGYRRDKEKDICGRTLYETLDQLSVWLESNISYEDDDSQADDVSRESSISSLTYSDLDLESEISIPKELLGEEEMEAEVVVEEEEEEEAQIEEEYMRPYIREWIVSEEEKPEEEPAPLSIVGEKIYEEELVFEEESLQPIEEESLQPIEEESMQPIEEEEILSSHEIERLQRAVVDEQWLLLGEEEEERGMKTPSEEGIPILEKAPSEGGLADVSSILNEIILRATPSEEERRLKIEEHSPDAMCCVTMKTWATWLVDVAQNTHNWCQWIQEVIAKVRFFAAVLKGEVKTPEGKTRILYKEEWAQFTETLAKDIEAWQKYNKHVKELSDKIIEGFQNKRIICCSACLKSKLIISEETAHQVTEQLVEALNTTAYWRGWLDAIVSEARKLAALDFQLPSITDQDVTSGSGSGSWESSLVFELIELKSPSTKTSSDTSVFVLEEVEGSVKEPEQDEN